MGMSPLSVVEMKTITAELDVLEFDLIRFAGLSAILSHGIGTLADKNPDNMEMAMGAMGSILFFKELVTHKIKAINASRELLGIDMIPEHHEQAFDVVCKSALRKNNQSPQNPINSDVVKKFLGE